jgi:hypothetical protein
LTTIKSPTQFKQDPPIMFNPSHGVPRWHIPTPPPPPPVVPKPVPLTKKLLPYLWVLPILLLLWEHIARQTQCDIRPSILFNRFIISSLTLFVANVHNDPMTLLKHFDPREAVQFLVGFTQPVVQTVLALFLLVIELIESHPSLSLTILVPIFQFVIRKSRSL